MKAVILAAGYGTRLTRDLENDVSGQYIHLKGIPKPLLPVGELPLISHWMNILATAPSITSIVVVTNEAHRERYEVWSQSQAMGVEILSDGSRSNEERSGCIACMDLGAAHGQWEDVLFLAGDTLFEDDFSLLQLCTKFKELQNQEKSACLILAAPVSEENVSKHGIIEVEGNGKVIKFLEKPNPSETSSRLQCPCFYFMSASSLHLLKDFLIEKKGHPLNVRDASGHFIAYAIHRAPIYAVNIKGRFDIGGLPSYIQCHQQFLQEQK